MSLQIRAENERMQAQLRSALEAKLVKEGEVTVLRSSLQRTNQQHADALAKLRASKEEADKREAAVQRQARADMELLRTQLLFKQTEMETSRRIPQSVKAKQTPLSTPSQSWSNLETPMRRVSKSPSKQHRHPPLIMDISPEKSRKSSMLPGFINAFSDTRPNGKNKGKEREVPIPSFQTGPASSPIRTQRQFDITDDPFTASQWPPKSSNVITSTPAPKAGDVGEDVDMLASSEVGDGEPVGQLEEIEDGDELGAIRATDWSTELSRLVLTHAYSNRGTTLQVLMSTTFPLRNEMQEKYTNTLSRILSALSFPSSPSSDYQIISGAFIDLATILNDATVVSRFNP